MKFSLLYPNVFRQRLLRLGVAAWLFGGVFLIFKLNEPAGFGLLLAFPVAAFAWSFFPKLNRQLFWCPFWAVVAMDGVAWQQAPTGPPARYGFADINSYRFVAGGRGKGSVLLRLGLQSGADVELVYQYSSESAAFQAAVEQAIRAHNRAHPAAELSEQHTAFERFFLRRVSTYVLGGMVVADVLAAVWGTRAGATGVQYAPLVLSFPYLLVWLAFAGKRA